MRSELWELYADLKKYQRSPPQDKATLAQRFDTLFSQKTRYQTLNQLLKRLHQNKAELLLVLERPEIPLHTNGSERDIRDYVKNVKSAAAPAVKSADNAATPYQFEEDLPQARSLLLGLPE